MNASDLKPLVRKKSLCLYMKERQEDHSLCRSMPPVKRVSIKLEGITCVPSSIGASGEQNPQYSNHNYLGNGVVIGHVSLVELLDGCYLL